MENLILKYLTDSISENEREQLVEYLQEPENRKRFKELVKINHRLNKEYTKVNTSEAKSGLLTSIPSKKLLKRKLFPILLKYAAVFAGVAIIGYGIYSNSPHQDNTRVNDPQITLQLEDGSIQIIDNNATASILDANGNIVSRQKNNQLFYSRKENSKILVYNTLHVPYGKSFKLELSDGTLVTLNAGTNLKYPVNFIKDSNRTVYLDGEAFFEVKKDIDHPFIVTTKDMDVQVLGTKFNITSYLEDQKTSTVLVNGKVQAYNKMIPEENVILEPNQRVSMENNMLKIDDVKVDKYIAWVQGQLIFEEDSFKVITNKLERKFNLKIINNYPDLENLNITASFSTETIDQVLKTFQTYQEFNYSIKNGVITISKPN